ncbi:MAG TPA: hypothetical protein VFX98_01370 [Longimicrobiaceae bacterium]|nr:hypothetical protein [Longimicrobiaceae bacterium]
MSSPLLTALLLPLAVLGAAALFARLLRSLLRLGLNVAEGSAAAGLAEVSARRGDLTGMAERGELVRAIRRSRRRNAALALLWLAVIVVPILLGGVREVYAAASLLWLLPRRPSPPHGSHVR